MSVRDWDAAVYERISAPQFEWGVEVLDRLALEGDETVLDAGCGSGRVTARLLERLPQGHVIAVDASPSMVEKARAALDPDRSTAFVSDLVELRVAEPVDAIVSTAVFHWIPDHDRLFERLYSALRPGGRLEAQCGGRGNLDRFHALALAAAMAEPQFAPYFAGWDGPWNYSSPERTAEALERAGFDEIGCRLETRLATPEEPREFLRVVCLGHHLERLPEDLRDPFVDSVRAHAGDPLELDYVRLNISARRAV